ncbi:MAG: C4-dicarboxylate ABC transporter [Betaproteobacteria bacterium RIFCSPLOWO2_12_FULL_62_13b]|nr:MAG: C4-dicarboxylate ABC transporter [Betaproteobacteria bacterium RIFCSPLOWO2_12_FULL_62_13b]
MKPIFKNRFFGLSLVALAAALVATPAHAQDKKLVLRVADSFPQGHYLSRYATKYWMETVTATTKGAVEFEHYPAEQLGKAKDLLALTLSGVTDVGYVGTAYVSDKMPLSAVAQLPGSFATSCEGTLAYWKLAKDGILAQREFAPNGVRLLFTVVLPPYQVGTTKQKIEGLKSLEGLKIRSTGGALDGVVRKLKAVPVQIAAPEIYEAMSRGTVDGGVLPFSSLFPYELHKLLKYSTIGENLGSFVANYVISEARWKKLPENVRKAMEDAGEAATKRTCALVDKDQDTDIEKLRQGGMTLVKLPATEHAALAALMASVGQEWAETLDKRGKPGTEVLKAFNNALK